MISEIVREMSALEDIYDVTSKRVLLWAQRSETQSVQKEILDSIKKAMGFDSIRKRMQRQDSETHKKQKQVEKERVSCLWQDLLGIQKDKPLQGSVQVRAAGVGRTRDSQGDAGQSMILAGLQAKTSRTRQA